MENISQIIQNAYDNGDIGDDEVSDVNQAGETLANLRNLFPKDHPARTLIMQAVKLCSDVANIER